MAKYKSYSYEQDQLVMMAPLKQLEVGTLPHTIHYLIEERIDDELFSDMFNNDSTGRPAYHPKLLLKIILLGYSRGILTSQL